MCREWGLIRTALAASPLEEHRMHGRDEGAIARHFGNSGLKRRNSQPRLLQIHHYVPQMSCQHRRCAGERPRISGCSLGHSAEYLAWGGRLLCAMLTLHNMQGWCPNLAACNSCDVQSGIVASRSLCAQPGLCKGAHTRCRTMNVIMNWQLSVSHCNAGNL